MIRRPANERAQELYTHGDLRGAEKLLRAALDRKPKEKWFSDLSNEYLWLGYIQQKRGCILEARRIFQELVAAEQTERIVRAKTMTCLAINFQLVEDYKRSNLWLERVEKLLEPPQSPGENTDYDKAMFQFLSSRGVIQYSQIRFQDAASSFGLCHDYISSVNAVEDSSKHFVTNYLNLFNCQLALGNIELAKEYLLLARAKILSLKTPYAHGLIHFFENLATFNLFAAGSTQRAIDSLMQISEEIVMEFAEFRRVFDFFSSIIVQLHEGKIDVEEIREQIRAYGDDPLIKAYLPTLLTGAPPPGSGDGDDDIPAARLAD